LIDSVEPWSNVLVNIINISARKAAERAERELAQTIIAIFNATPAHIAMIDEQGVIKNVNEEWRQFAKNNALISNNYCLGENYLTVCESVDAPEEARAIAVGIRYVLGGKIPRFSLEYPCHSPDEQRWFRCTITPLHEDFHHGAVITHINITERKLAEEKIKEITSRFQAMFDYAPYGIMLVDVKLSEVVQWNARLVSMLGSESVVVNNGQLKNDFIGRLIEEVRKFALLAGSSEDNTKIQCEYNNNGLRYFEVSIAPVYLNNDVAQHYLCMVEDVTDFRVVEAEKVEVERLYKDIVNSVDSVVWQVDAETFQFTYVSKQAEAILGYSVEECLQKDFWLEHLHPEDKESAANFCMSKTQMLESHIFEYRFIKKDGSVIWLQDVVNVIAENNKPKFLRGLLIDITNNKLQENRKKIHNRVMELIATDASLDDVLILIADYLCSAHVGIDCGIDLYDKENNMSTALILPELPVDVLTFIDQCRVEQCALHHAVFDDQAFFAHKEQCLYEMGIKSYCEQLIFSTSGEVLGVIFLYVRDVGYPSKEDSEELKAAARLAAIVIERKKNEQNIQLISDRLQLATTSAGVGIWDYSVETQNTIWNDVMYQLFGLQPIKEDGTDAHWLKGVHQDDQKYIQQEMQLTLETGKEFKIEFRVYWPDNSLHTLFGVGAAQRNTKNVIERVIGTCWDISELKNTEYQLRQLNDHLEERVSLRTVELERAKDLAEIASKAKTNFLSNMSHEIRTPMNSLIGMAYLLSNTTLNKKQQVYLNAIQKSGKHLLYIIDDILDFSKIEAGKLLLSKHVFDVLDLKNIIEDLFLQAAEAKFLSLIVNVADDIPKVVYGDMHRLQQVLFNLVGNAIKFTHKGGVTVNIDVANKKGDELLLLFKISDTGIGMSAEQQRRLFQPFVQGDTSISRRFGGTGLGLVISMELVMLMDGEMGVHSQLGEGTEMWFTCLLEVNTSQSQSQSQSQSLDALLNARILIVEDNEFNQQVAVDLLECVGAVSFVANNGQEAIEMLHSNSYDCILMDMQMPVMDGLQAARLIRENTAIKQIPIIAMTANASERERALCIEAGMNDFISKPVNPDVFYQMIAQWLSEIESIDALEHVVEEIMLENKDTIDLPNNPAVIDLNILASLLGYNRDKLNTFSYKFIETAQKGMLDISNAIANNDEKALHATGHRIKSSAKTVGALDFAALCQSLETVDIAKKDYVGQIVAQLDQLLVEIQSVVDSYFSVSIEDNEVFIDEESSNLRVLVIDDEEFQIDYVKAKLHALNIVDVIPAFNGDQAMAQFDAANPKPELIICDINMPWMDGIEFLRNLSERKYKGGVILLSGMDASMLKAAELLAGVHKVNLLAALPKPLKLDALLVALAKLDDILNKDSDLYSNDLIESKILTIEELRHAILNGQLELYYQPKVLVVDKSVIGFECLVRIRHPEKGLIQPNDFISIAEQYHLIDDLTLEVLNKAAVQLGEWRSQGHNLVASVNVSMDNLTCLTLPELFERVVRNASIEPKNIILELTESRLMQNYSVSLEIITRLRLKGFGLSIDDFGTGFSSMDNLKNLPVTELKVDRAFVRGATKDKSANTILSSSIALGKSFNLMVVAEGVETEEDWNLIEEKGCDEAQGYFIARPMTAEDFIVWKQSWDEKHNIS
jgi:PAS domain S-box-containing protein